GCRPTVAKDAVLRRAPDPPGVFWGLQPLRQLLPSAGFRRAFVPDAAWAVPCVEIDDRPRFAWRGSHLDVGRHFMPKDWILKHLDLMALHKLNVFHWHLTEDQGWRIEIRRYPKLTAVGAWRADSQLGLSDGEPANRRSEGKQPGRYYPQAAVRQVV